MRCMLTRRSISDTKGCWRRKGDVEAKQWLSELEKEMEEEEEKDK